ncbi:D-lactaldehyde dehydrogenase [Coprinopsis sp. MPI-PUGE-AT-0042]|nr:D-lactaldehyde dehydrogenase [Coprinopsis sp. MPI-PUGE-AT-0042]
MPTISPTDKILVTGANGYVALWITKVLLERGNSVRAAVRSEAKSRHLRGLFKSYGDKLEVAIVPDMTKDGAWDEAVNGVQAIQHTAFPVGVSELNPNPEDYIGPAVKGTVGILESALKYKSDIKRVVITSSIGAVASPFDPPPPFPLTEENWNETAPKMVKEKGTDAGASKVLAERAAWDFVKKHKSEISWDITTIAPPMASSPPLGDATTPEAFNISVRWFFDRIVSEGPKVREMLASPSLWVDVRDLAEAQVLALEKEKAGGERILAVAGAFVWQDFVDVANGLGLVDRKFSKGFPELSRELPFDVDATKSKELLGLAYRSKEDTTRSMLEDFSRRGF